MLDKIHDHIVSELGHSSRTDTIFVVTAIVFNLVVLGINSGVSAAAAEEVDSTMLDVAGLPHLCLASERRRPEPVEGRSLRPIGSTIIGTLSQMRLPCWTSY
jgi:hypothetical protein